MQRLDDLPWGHEGYYLVPLTYSEMRRLRSTTNKKMVDEFIEILRSTPYMMGQSGKRSLGQQSKNALSRKNLPKVPSVLFQVVPEFPRDLFGIIYDGMGESGVLYTSERDRLFPLLQDYKIPLGSTFLPHFAHIQRLENFKTKIMKKRPSSSSSISPTPSPKPSTLSLDSSRSSIQTKAKELSKVMATIFLTIMLIKIIAMGLSRNRSLWKKRVSYGDILEKRWQSGDYSHSSKNDVWRLIADANTLRVNPQASLKKGGSVVKRLPTDMVDLHDLLKKSLEHGWNHIMLAIIKSGRGHDLLHEHKEEILIKMKEEGNLIHQFRNRILGQLQATPLPPQQTVSSSVVVSAPPSSSFQQKQQKQLPGSLLPKTSFDEAFSSLSQIRPPSGLGFTATFSKDLLQGLVVMFPILATLKRSHQDILVNYIRNKFEGRSTKRQLRDLFAKPEFMTQLSQFVRNCLDSNDPSLFVISPTKSVRRPDDTNLFLRSRRRLQQPSSSTITPVVQQQRPKTQFQKFWENVQSDPILLTPSSKGRYGAIGPSRRN